MTNKHKPLTQEEKQYILANYKTKFAIELSRELNRSRTCVETFLKKYNLKSLKERCPKTFGLSPREHEAMTYFAQGYTKQEVLKKMYISETTLNSCLSRVFEKYLFEQKKGKQQITQAVLIWLQRNGKLQNWELTGIEQ